MTDKDRVAARERAEGKGRCEDRELGSERGQRHKAREQGQRWETQGQRQRGAAVELRLLC